MSGKSFCLNAMQIFARETAPRALSPVTFAITKSTIKNLREQRLHRGGILYPPSSSGISARRSVAVMSTYNYAERS
jgi:hypothetical protein